MKISLPTRGDKAARGGGMNLFLLGTLIFLAAAALIAGTNALTQQVLAAQAAKERVALTQILAESFANRVQNVIGQYAHIADAVVKDPALAEAFAGATRETLAQRAAQLKPMFPGALLVRLLPPGVKDVDNSQTPHLGYAALDMLHQAETSRDELPAEVHVFGSPQQEIALVRRVLHPGDQRYLGSLMLSLPVGLLKQAFRHISDPAGYVELWQETGKGEHLLLASRGDELLKRGSPGTLLPVAGTRWRLAYWPAVARGGLSPQNLVLVWGAVGLSVLLIAVIVFVVMRLLAGALRSDMTQVVHLFKDLREGRGPGSYRARYKSVGQTMALIREIGAGKLGAAAPAGTAKKGRTAQQMEAEEVDALVPSLEDDIFGKQELTDQDLAPSLIFGGHSGGMVVEEEAQEPGGADGGGLSDAAANIFGVYDIRGVVGTALTEQLAEEIGRAIGSEAYDRGEQTVIVARDARRSSPKLGEALIRGLTASGRDVIDIGQVPTPLLYFATHQLGATSGVVVTGSHNPADYNGFKVVLRGEALTPEELQGLRRRVQDEDFLSGRGQVSQLEVIEQYIERVTMDVQLARPLKVVVDCGNAIAGVVAPRLLRALGCEVVELFCDIDPRFPNHHPDPSVPENLVALVAAVREQQADLGLAFDGDGDRLGVVASDGKIIWPDRVMMLFAKDVLSRNPGAEVVFDVKCSNHLAQVIEEAGGEPVMWKTGHSLLKAKVKETGAPLGGELSGHIVFRERWFGFDDAIYAAARLLELLAARSETSAEIFAVLPEGVSTPELHVEVKGREHFRLMQRLLTAARFEGARLSVLDGLRADFDDGWGLVRASNTTPTLVFRFEADSAEALKRIQEQFRAQLLALDPKVELPF